ncbi:MAG: hypothetical protein JW940_35260 [Polyangiaceae bacterium]|nr:hypothetical protein [Polyangiaceae bacterium]
MSRSDVWWCAWLALLGSTAQGCGTQDEKRDSDQQAGTGTTGGATSTTGRPGEAGRAEGGSGGMGAGTKATGNGEAGGAAGPSAAAGGAQQGQEPERSLADRALAACESQQAIGYLFGCMAVYESGYLSDCTKAWLDAAEQCPTEAESLLDCSDLREAMDYECDANRDVVLAPGVCEEQNQDLHACLGE